MTTMEERFGLRIKALRAKRDITQVELAEKSGVTLGHLARMEVGYHDPKLSMLYKLAKALKCDPRELVP